MGGTEQQRSGSARRARAHQTSHLLRTFSLCAKCPTGLSASASGSLGVGVSFSPLLSLPSPRLAGWPGWGSASALARPAGLECWTVAGRRRELKILQCGLVASPHVLAAPLPLSLSLPALRVWSLPSRERARPWGPCGRDGRAPHTAGRPATPPHLPHLHKTPLQFCSTARTSSSQAQPAFDSTPLLLHCCLHSPLRPGSGRPRPPFIPPSTYLAS